MAKGAATEDRLAKLHAVLAQVIEAQLSEKLLVNKEEAEAGEEEEQWMYTASPALLTMAARFLKDNDITADVGDAEGRTDAIQKRLAEIRSNGGKVVRLSDLHPVAQDG